MPFGIQWINFYAQVHHENWIEKKNIKWLKIILKKSYNADTCYSTHI